MDRIKKLCERLTRCNVFADVGCDHGLCTLYMLENGLCDSAIISDISEKSLAKAEKLLKKYIDGGICRPVCCDGLGAAGEADLVLIAGLGGENMISMMERDGIPRNFVLQPMHSVPRVREYLLENGASITRDDVFASGGKFYFTVCGTRQGGSDSYSEACIKYGKGDVNGDLGRYLRLELAKKYAYLGGNAGGESRRRILRDIRLIEGVLSGETE